MFIHKNVFCVEHYDWLGVYMVLYKWTSPALSPITLSQKLSPCSRSLPTSLALKVGFICIALNHSHTVQKALPFSPDLTLFPP